MRALPKGLWRGALPPPEGLLLVDLIEMVEVMSLLLRQL